MSAVVTGAALGGVAGCGAALLAARVRPRRDQLERRVLPHLRDLPQLAPTSRVVPGGQVRMLLASGLDAAATRLGRLLGGSASIRRRVERAGLELTVGEFRIQQVVWGLAGFVPTAAVAVLVSLRSPQRAVPLAVLCLVAFLVGALLRENRLTASVVEHERRVLEELPVVAELLALAVAAGEGPVGALARVVTRSRGALADDLGQVLGRIRSGVPVSVAFDGYAARTGLPVVARFADGIAVAIERGTPLSDVLHAQAGDVREARRRALIESGARREVLMMVPVVFLVLPVTVLFAFWPGLVGLRLATS